MRADRAVRPKDAFQMLESLFLVVEIGTGQNGHGIELLDGFYATDPACLQGI
jgi:hypothetical protein